ncbi:hypothetical protein LP415_00640 [Polaromonas sp. P1(28)-8]|nr:hypothetical protein LP415_00640 [Polaromonas sp. P1(28)-8]
MKISFRRVAILSALLFFALALTWMPGILVAVAVEIVLAMALLHVALT